MKSNFKIVLGSVFIVLVIFSSWQCNKTPINSSTIRQYSYLTPIVNPPDTFQVAFNLSTYGDKVAIVTFQDSAVWQIKILSDSRALFQFINPEDSVWIAINAIDTIGFQGGLPYIFVANNNSIENMGIFFVEFKKLSIPYSGFHKKY